MDSAGNLYGTTSGGGSGGSGTVYKIDPAGTETILYSFGIGNADGAIPSGDLIMRQRRKPLWNDRTRWSVLRGYGIQDQCRRHGNDSPLLRRKRHRWAGPRAGLIMR